MSNLTWPRAHPSLSKLDVSFNQITHIAAAAGASPSGLTAVDCSHNRLESMPVLPPVLRTATLSGNAITVVPPDTLPHTLKALVLDHNMLSAAGLPQPLPLPALELLDLRFNRLSSVPQRLLEECLQLQELLLNSNGLATVSLGAFANLPALQTLSLRNNSLRALPAGLFNGAVNLQVLDASANRLASVGLGALRGADADTPSNLTSLSLADNAELGSLPTDWHLPYLEQLDAARCGLGPDLDQRVLAGVPQLRFLGLQGNRLAVAPNVSHCAQLEHLWLFQNTIAGVLDPTALPAGNASVLTTLHLFDNALSGLPKRLRPDGASALLWRQLTLFGNGAGSGGSGGHFAVPSTAFGGLVSPDVQVWLGAEMLATLPAQLAPPPGDMLYFMQASTRALLRLQVPALLLAGQRGLACQCDGSDSSSLCNCTLCPAGSYGQALDAPDAGPAGPCLPCPRGGFFQDQLGAVSCKLCPPGSYVEHGAGASLTVSQGGVVGW